MIVSSSTALCIYTDGSCRHHPRRGGVGFRLVFPDYCEMDEVEKDYSPTGFKGATINQMELKACILALEEAMTFQEINQIQRIIIHTDSKYVKDNYPRAIHQWSKNKWGKTSGAPVLNADLWKELLKTVQKTRKRVEIVWVKGHAKNEHNKAADRLAKASSKRPINRLPNIVDVRRKWTDKKIDVGCVKMCGQKIAIRIVVSEYLSVQKITKYTYEIISKSSKYYGLMDVIFSTHLLKAHHCYLVSFNKNNEFPQILKIFEEIAYERNDKKCLN